MGEEDFVYEHRLKWTMNMLPTSTKLGDLPKWLQKCTNSGQFYNNSVLLYYHICHSFKVTYIKDAASIIIK